VLVTMNYFTKWMEVILLKNMTHREVIHFISEYIIHRFGIPQMLTTDQGSSFTSHQIRDFVESLKIKLLSSSPYYTHANGQTESSNKTLIKLIKKKIEENPKRWHEVLSEALWAHRISKHSATKVTPFELVYRQEAILPVEVNLDALRIAQQNELSVVDYHNLMLNRVDEVSDERVMSYPVFMTKPCTHHMHDPGSIVSDIRPKVLTDNQMSRIKYNYYVSSVSKDYDDSQRNRTTEDYITPQERQPGQHVA
jgi:hypothetical protein